MVRVHQVEKYLIDREAFVVVVLARIAVNLMAELTLDLYEQACVAVVLYHHFVDVSGARALAARQNARIVVDLVAAGELAHHNIFEPAHLLNFVYD